MTSPACDSTSVPSSMRTLNTATVPEYAHNLVCCGGRERERTSVATVASNWLHGESNHSGVRTAMQATIHRTHDAKLRMFSLNDTRGRDRTA